MRDLQTFREFAGTIPVRFTHHAIDRLRESQLDKREGKRLLYESLRSPFKVNWETKKHTDNKNNTTFWLNGTIFFTVIATKGKTYGDEIFLVITVTDSRAVDRRFRVLPRIHYERKQQPHTP